MLDFSKLLDIKFLVDTNPPANFAFRDVFLVVFGLIIFMAVIVWLTAHFLLKNSKLLCNLLQGQVFYVLLTLGIGGLILTLLRSIGAAFLSMRLILLLFLLAVFIWAVYLVLYLLITFPQKYRQEKDEKRREKYLPRRNKYI